MDIHMPGEVSFDFLEALGADTPSLRGIRINRQLDEKYCGERATYRHAWMVIDTQNVSLTTRRHSTRLGRVSVGRGDKHDEKGSSDDQDMRVDLLRAKAAVAYICIVEALTEGQVERRFDPSRAIPKATGPHSNWSTAYVERLSPNTISSSKQLCHQCDRKAERLPLCTLLFCQLHCGK